MSRHDDADGLCRGRLQRGAPVASEMEPPMPTYEPSLFVEPLGYQPVEFLDIPPMSESHELSAAASAASPRAAQVSPMPASPLR